MILRYNQTNTNWFKQYLFMNFTQVNIFTVSVGIEQQEKSYVKLSPNTN